MGITGLSSANQAVTSLIANGAASVQGQAAISMMEAGASMAETAMSKLLGGMDDMLLDLMGNAGTGLGQNVDITI